MPRDERAAMLARWRGENRLAVATPTELVPDNGRELDLGDGWTLPGERRLFLGKR